MHTPSLILHNLRSAHNVGAIFRSADAFGVAKLYLSGITPYPTFKGDSRPPHVRASVTHKIAKTALGAEGTVAFEYHPDIQTLISRLKDRHINIYALEQTPGAHDLAGFQPQSPCALLIGNEVKGLDKTVLTYADAVVEIPMQGEKESLNAAVAASIALYALSRPRH